MRTLTVSELFSHRSYSGEKRTPYLRLRGQWLAKHGFAPGQKVRVVEAPGGLLIQPV